MARRKVFRKRINLSVTILTAFGLFLFIFFFISFNNIASVIKSKSSEEKLISARSLDNLPLTPPPQTPTPTPSPTPTPIPLVGFCLNVPVLMYHHIQPEAEAQTKGQKALTVDNGRFDEQIGYLVSHGYSVISAQSLVDALISHTRLVKSVVVTIDDGYSDIYTYAYPVLQKYHVIANLMIPTGLLGGADYMSWGQLEEMVHSGLAYATDHTWSHYNVASGSSDKIKYEIATGKQQLQDHTGQNVDVFTYPYGTFNSNAISILQQEGIRGAFSEIPGQWQCDSFLMTLHRTRIGNAPLSAYGLY